jgi:hypothetical protein
VARLEWAVHESFHAADPTPFDFAALVQVAPDRQGTLRFRLAPAVRLVASTHPVLAIWEANQPLRDGCPDRAQGPDHVLVRRAGFEVSPMQVDPATWAFLDALAGGAALERASETLGADEGRLASLMARWIGDGVIAGFEMPEHRA